MLNQRAQIIQSIDVSQSLGVTVNVIPSPFFWVNLQPPRGPQPKRVRSPREDLVPYTLRYSVGVFAPRGKVKPGSWLDVDGIKYECISIPANRLFGQAHMGSEAQLLPLDDVYPFRAAVVEKGDHTNPPQDVPIAFWDPTEDTRDHGSYISYTGYMPIAYHGIVDMNSEVLVGSKRFTITREGMDTSAGIVLLTLRGTGRG